jgi:thermitase
MRRIALLLAACACGWWTLPAAALADAGDVLVRFKPSVGEGARADARRDARVTRAAALPVPGLEHVRPHPGVSAAEAAAALSRDPAVLYAEPDVARAPALETRDPSYSLQWGFEQISARQAWDVTTGDGEVLVAVLDSGVDLDHPDLAGNLVAGYDFVDEDDTPEDTIGHGSHIAGVIGAVTDNQLGVAGLNWQVQVMPLRVINSLGNGYTTVEIPAIVRASQAGARVVNMSYSSAQFSAAERDAIAAAPDTLFVAAAGNDGTDNDRFPQYPCAYDLPNILCVTASARNDVRPDWANTGPSSVDLAAPGAGIWSTFSDSRWAYDSGTSMATAFVSGTAALLLARERDARPEDLASAILGTVDLADAFKGVTLTGGRLNAAAAMSVVAATPKPARTPTPTPTLGPPEPTPTPVLPSAEATPSPNPPAPEPAKLKVRRAGIRNGQLELVAEITRRATGVVAIDYRSNGRTTRAQARIGQGRVRVNVPLPKAQRHDSGIVTLTWAGSSSVRAASVRLRAANQPAALRRGTVQLRAGVLQVDGTISKRARGGVRLELSYAEGAGVRSVEFNARIRNGRWKLSAPVPVPARAGGYLTIQFTGYEDAPGGAMRGEQDAKQVTGT